jgi:hypothetical protein
MKSHFFLPFWKDPKKGPKIGKKTPILSRKLSQIEGFL